MRTTLKNNVHWRPSSGRKGESLLELKIGDVVLKSFSGREFNSKDYSLKAWIEYAAECVGLVSKIELSFEEQKKIVRIWNNLFGRKQNPESYESFVNTHEKK